MAPASVERLTALSQAIAEKTAVITDYLTSNGLEAASFDVDGLAVFPIPIAAEKPYNARLDLIALTKELHDIALGPRETVKYLAWDGLNILSLQAIWEFKVAQAVPIDDKISYEDLTAKVVQLNNGLNIPMLNLRRLIRHAIVNQVFCEPSKGFVAHTRSSRLLTEDIPMNNWVGFMCSDLGLPVANTVNALKKWPGSEESNETGVNVSYDKDIPFFEFFKADKSLAQRYSLAMQSFGGGEGYSAQGVVEGYSWDQLSDGATVVDMGGNQGYISFALAEVFPKLNFIVQDKAGMRTPETIGTVPEALQDRVQLTTHDFFTPQTVVAEVYFFRMIFHGFSDKYCVQILQALVPALRTGAKIVLNDGGLSEPGTSGYMEEKTMRSLDLLMQVTVNAREREEDDWKELLRLADSGYSFVKAWKPEKSRMWFVEAEWTK